MANPLTINGVFGFSGIRRFEPATSCADKKDTLKKGIAMTVASLGLMGFFGGCASPTPPIPVAAPVIAPPPPAPTALTAEADEALQAAERSILEARAKKSVWTSAVQQLDKARAAAKVFDSPSTLAHAKEVVALCVLSIQQTTLPPVKW